ncbi:alpha/beta hydrolase [Nocardia vaccinii]|uniref:alpha/beta hydrolase n=1 Tax=Nocardia vaccinii TaxID=1822 RepID=UPI000830D4ED|nr:alpha/beta hydrolase [Nocardia vaccinii]
MSHNDPSSQFHKWIIQAHLERLRRGLAGGVSDRIPEELRAIGIELSDSARNIAEKLAAEITRRASGIRRLRSGAAEKDALGAELLKSLRNEEVMSGSTAERIAHIRAERPEDIDIGTLGESMPRLPDDPKELNEFWSTLSPTEKATVWAADNFVGNLDGIPQAERDFFNRLNLHNLLTRARVEGNPEAITSYEQIENAIGEEGKYYLSYLDKDFRTAISRENPDESDFIVTYLGGAGTSPVKNLNIAEKLRNAARGVRREGEPEPRVAAIRWQSYQRPPSARYAWDPSYADNAAPLLRRYQQGLQVTHMGEGQPYTTMVGHSYGNVVLGHAADGEMVGDAALHADNLVLVGSFGVGVDHVSDLRLAGVDTLEMKNRVYATMAEYDSFKTMPKHGRMPTSPEFGAKVFTSESTRGPWKSAFLNPKDHAGYFGPEDQVEFNPDNPTMVSIGKIILGRGAEVA